MMLPAQVWDAQVKNHVIKELPVRPKNLHSVYIIIFKRLNYLAVVVSIELGCAMCQTK
jgi:hypothetical protein